MWIAQLVGQGVGIVAGAENQKTADKYNSMVQAEQEQVAQMRADLNVQEVQRQDRYQRGQTEASYGGSGVTFSGSPMDELAFQSINDQFKQNVARFNGLVDASADEANSNLSNFLGNQAETSGYIQAGTAIGNDLINHFYTPDKKGGNGNGSNSGTG